MPRLLSKNRSLISRPTRHLWAVALGYSDRTCLPRTCSHMEHSMLLMRGCRRCVVWGRTPSTPRPAGRATRRLETTVVRRLRAPKQKPQNKKNPTSPVDDSPGKSEKVSSPASSIILAPIATRRMVLRTNLDSAPQPNMFHAPRPPLLIGLLDLD